MLNVSNGLVICDSSIRTNLSPWTLSLVTQLPIRPVMWTCETAASTTETASPFAKLMRVRWWIHPTPWSEWSRLSSIILIARSQFKTFTFRQINCTDTNPESDNAATALHHPCTATHATNTNATLVATVDKWRSVDTTTAAASITRILTDNEAFIEEHYARAHSITINIACDAFDAVPVPLFNASTHQSTLISAYTHAPVRFVWPFAWAELCRWS